MEVLLGIICVFSLVGAIAYNPLRRKMTGIIGVGGAYMITIGIMCLGMCIGQLFGDAEVGVNWSEIIVVVVFMLGCLGYMVYVMLTRCHTAAQRILLPFAAFMIGMGFAWRFLLALFLHIPMESGKATASVLPTVLYDDKEEEWRWQSGESGGYVTYICTKTGQTIGFHTSGDMWIPNGWRIGS